MSVGRFAFRTIFHVAGIWLLLTLPSDGVEDDVSIDRRVERARVIRLFGGKGWVRNPNRVWPELNRDACRRLSLPKEAMDRRRWDLEPPITSFANLTIPGTRALLIYPRMGLGNTLRGFKSAYFYSLFSGRRLVVVISGPHRKGLNALCKAFHCSVDLITDENDTSSRTYKRLYRPVTLTRGQEINLVENFNNSASVMTVHSAAAFDKYWLFSKALRTCLFTTLDCGSRYCVNLRAMNYLLGGGPKEILGETIGEILKGSAVGQRVPAIPENKGLRLGFDVAIHIRTYTRMIEGVRLSKKCQAKNDCSSELKRIKLREKEQQHAYIVSSFWQCVKNYLLKLQEFLAVEVLDPQPRLNIFLATDNQSLRPIFVRKLKNFGVVYYSVGSVVHSSRGGSSDLPTMSEFFLISSSKFMLSFRKPISTFAQAAVEFGNVTASVFDNSQIKCTFRFPYTGIGTRDMSFKKSLERETERK